MLNLSKFLRAKLRRYAIFLVALCAYSMPATAQNTSNYPSAPIKMIVSFAPGGGTDALARVLAQVMSQRMNVTVVVENRAGAGGSIGTMAGAAAAPDGYTLLVGSNATMVLNPILQAANLKYQVERDFLPISGIASIPYLLAAHPSLAASDIRSMIELGKKQKLSFASPGNGTTNHLVGVLLESVSGVDMLHIPYRGAAPAMNDVVSGQVNFLSGDLSTLAPMVASGKLKALAVTGAQRVPLMPQVPTVAESGFASFEATGWFGLFAPAGTPAAIVQRLGAEVQSALADPRMQSKMRELGGSPLSHTGEALRGMVRQESTKWRKLIEERRVTADALQ